MIYIIETTNTLMSPFDREALTLQVSKTLSACNNGVYITINTCHRSTIVIDGDNDQTKQLLHRICSKMPAGSINYFYGMNAVKHLFSLTSGLLSPSMGETEIQGQVKSAYKSASRNQRLTSCLHYLMQKSLHVGKKIRHTLIPNNQTHIVSEVCEELITTKKKHQRILCIGYSHMNRRLATVLKGNGHDIYFSNRSARKGLENENVIAWSDIEAKLVLFSSCIVCTSSKRSFPFLTPQNTKHLDCLIDLSHPLNTPKETMTALGDLSYSIDDIHRICQKKTSTFNTTKSKKAIHQSVKYHYVQLVGRSRQSWYQTTA
jgi:glutamyl-tRNA reductase